MGQVNVAGAVVGFTPFVKLLMLDAEGTPASGAEKHAAVAQSAQMLYKVVQDSGTVPAFTGVPWELVAPIVIGVEEGALSLITTLAQQANHLLGKLWGKLFGATAAAPAAA